MWARCAKTTCLCVLLMTHVLRHLVAHEREHCEVGHHGKHVKSQRVLEVVVGQVEHADTWTLEQTLESFHRAHAVVAQRERVEHCQVACAPNNKQVCTVRWIDLV
jgi:hypothetical protein